MLFKVLFVISFILNVVLVGVIYVSAKVGSKAQAEQESKIKDFVDAFKRYAIYNGSDNLRLKNYAAIIELVKFLRDEPLRTYIEPECFRNSCSMHAKGTCGPDILWSEIIVDKQYLDDPETSYFLDIVNKIHGINLKKEPVTHAIFTILHELGHHIDWQDNLYRIGEHNEDYILDRRTLEDKWETEEQKDIAYRHIPQEYYADKFAVDTIKEWFPELLDEEFENDYLYDEFEDWEYGEKEFYKVMCELASLMSDNYSEVAKPIFKAICEAEQKDLADKLAEVIYG